MFFKPVNNLTDSFVFKDVLFSFNDWNDFFESLKEYAEDGWYLSCLQTAFLPPGEHAIQVRAALYRDKSKPLRSTEAEENK